MVGENLGRGLNSQFWYTQWGVGCKESGTNLKDVCSERKREWQGTETTSWRRLGPVAAVTDDQRRVGKDKLRIEQQEKSTNNAKQENKHM